MRTVAVSAVSRQLHRTAAESNGRMKNNTNGLLQPVEEKASPVNTAMSTPCVRKDKRASSHQLFHVTVAIRTAQAA